MKINTKDITLVAVFTAVMVIFAQISIPLQPVPITLSIFAVFLSSLLLGWRRGTIVQIIYVLLGICGAPVFQGFTGGAARVFGPTGGYIMSYIVMAFVMGIITEKLKVKKPLGLMLVMLVGLAICYTLGTAWLITITKMDIAKALKVAVIPFIPLDLVKIGASAFIAYELKVRLVKLRLLPQ